MLKQLNLYSTTHCHLCETAHALLLNFTDNIAFVMVDIAEDAVLLEQYSLRIPVLQRQDTKAELDWPFTSANIQQFIA